jgi:hypothetical protein
MSKREYPVLHSSRSHQHTLQDLMLCTVVWTLYQHFRERWNSSLLEDVNQPTEYLPRRFVPGYIYFTHTPIEEAWKFRFFLHSDKRRSPRLLPHFLLLSSPLPLSPPLSSPRPHHPHQSLHWTSSPGDPHLPTRAQLLHPIIRNTSPDPSNLKAAKKHQPPSQAQLKRVRRNHTTPPRRG